MSRMSRWMFISGAIFSVLTPIMAVNFINSETYPEKEVVATQDIPPYTKITQEMVTIKRVPKGAVPSDAIQDVRDVVGKYVRTNVGTGHIVQRSHFASVTGDSEAVAVTDQKDPYIRGFLLPFSLFQSKKMMVVGDHIDLISVINSKDKGPVVSVLGKRIPILAVNLPENGYESGTVMVGVDSLLQEKIAYALTAGKLYVSLTPYDGKSPDNLPSVDITTFGAAVSAPIPSSKGSESR
jgi:Flp pilus assembly protein CpaB